MSRMASRSFAFIAINVGAAVLTCGIAIVSSAQTGDEAAIRLVLQKSYAAYQQKDAEALFSMVSRRSPMLAAIKWSIQSDFAAVGEIEIRNLTIRGMELQGDNATVRLCAEMYAVNKNTGEAAEFNGKRYMTYQLVREAGGWKLWNASGDEETLAVALLGANSKDDRDRLLRAAGPVVSAELVDQLVGRGNELVETGDYGKAMTVFDLAYAIAEHLDDKGALAAALYGLGHGNSAQGNREQAASYFQKSLAIYATLANRSVLAFALGHVGMDYSDRGDYRQAIEYYARSLKVGADVGSKKDIASTLESIGDLFGQQGNDDQAMEHFQKSLALFTELEAGIDLKVRVTNLLGKIAGVLTRRGAYAQALEYYEKSRKMFEAVGHKPGIAISLFNIGNINFAQARYTEALNYYQKSLALAEEVGHKPGIGATLSSIGNVYYGLGDYDRAVEFCGRAVGVANEIDGSSIPPWILTSLGKAYLAADKYDQARQALTAAISAVEKLRGQVAGNERDRQLFFEGRLEPYSAMVELLIKQHRFAEALVYAERAKGRVLLDVLRNGRENITGTMTPEEQSQERRLNGVILTLNSQLRETARRELEKASLAGIEARLKKARLEYDGFLTALYAAHHRLKVQRGETEPLSLDEVGVLLPDSKTALLEYVVTRERTYLFVLSKRNSLTDNPGDVALSVYPIEITARDLAGRATRFRAKVATNSADFREPARQLYDLLLGPAQKDLAGKTTVCFVPDGSLWELPFQALLSKPDRYVLEDHAVFYVPSLSVLREIKRRAAAGAYETSQNDDPLRTKRDRSGTGASRELFAVGNPSLTMGRGVDPRTPGGDPADGPLPEAEQTVAALRRIYGPGHSKILTGQAAQEETIKSEIGKYRILHFATHATLDDENPLYSRLLLTSSSAGEDGFLEAREIMRLELRADLAVLSACQTALGRVSAGEGLIGMAWALFVAGTPTTVASQWKVDSRGTARLMIAFHRLLKSQLSRTGLRLNKAEALRHAALGLMSEPEYHHPFYWAGFVVMGDGL